MDFHQQLSGFCTLDLPPASGDTCACNFSIGIIDSIDGTSARYQCLALNNDNPPSGLQVNIHINRQMEALVTKLELSIAQIPLGTLVQEALNDFAEYHEHN